MFTIEIKQKQGKGINVALNEQNSCFYLKVFNNLMVMHAVAAAAAAADGVFFPEPIFIAKPNGR